MCKMSYLFKVYALDQVGEIGLSVLFDWVKFETGAAGVWKPLKGLHLNNSVQRNENENDLTNKTVYL